MKLPRSSLVRPLDPRYPTNRAVLIIIPIAGLLAAGVALVRVVSGGQLVLAALGGAGTAFASWALARELAPDDNPAAFVSMVLAYTTYLLVGHTSVMLLVLALMLVRTVNRSVGIPPQPLDYVSIAVLVAWVGYSSRDIVPWSDAFRGTPRWALWAIAAIALAYVGVIVTTRQVRSVGDLTGEPLQLRRVRAGMVTGLAVSLTGVLPIAHAPARSAPIWATLLGIVVGHIRFSRWKTTPSQA
jgi:hypothetical protein